MLSRFPIFIAVAAAVVVFAGPPTAAPVLAQANDVFAYPLAGQSQEQQSRDRFDCHQWAVQQSGFDPFAAPPPPQQTQQQGGGTILGLGRGGLFPGTGMFGDAATGAGLGAAGGAIAGSPGKGAAIGAVGGAILGGLAGAQFGAGEGRLWATGIGAVLGALAGSEIGKSLDRADKAYMSSTTQATLEHSQTGSTSTWRNPDSGHTGSVTPTRTYQRADGRYCREFQQTVTIGGKQEKAYGTACRQPDGTWQIVS